MIIVKCYPENMNLSTELEQKVCATPRKYELINRAGAKSVCYSLDNDEGACTVNLQIKRYKAVKKKKSNPGWTAFQELANLEDVSRPSHDAF